MCFTTERIHQSRSASAQLSSLPACRLLMFVNLQTTRFPWRCPEGGKNSIASGLSLKPITANAVWSLDNRRLPYPLRCCCIGGCLCRWFSPAQPASVGRRPGADGGKPYITGTQFFLLQERPFCVALDFAMPSALCLFFPD